MSNLARAESGGSLPTYATVAANEMLARQAELRERIRSSTFVGHQQEPEVEDLGPEDSYDQREQDDARSPSLETVVLPPPMEELGATGSASFQEELLQAGRRLRSQGPVID